jgi:hypothetical protein
MRYSGDSSCLTLVRADAQKAARRSTSRWIAPGGSVLDRIADMLIKLLKERESNKQLVLRECLMPVKAEIDTLHQHYLEHFHSYISDLENGAAADSLLPAVSLDLDRGIVSRQKKQRAAGRPLAGLARAAGQVRGARIRIHARRGGLLGSGDKGRSCRRARTEGHDLRSQSVLPQDSRHTSNGRIPEGDA